jgi:hypothetical protein
MTFLAPAFLWSLLALLPLAAIYFLKVKPRRRTTTAYFLWSRVLAEKQATSLLQRLRDLFSLLLMLLAFAAISLALAKPEFTSDERKDLILLIDHSASMSALEGGTSRLDAAKESAREIVRALDGNQRAAVVSIAREARFHSHLSASPRELLEAIDGIEPTDFPSNAAALRGFSDDTREGGDHRLLLLSDANFEEAASLPAEIELIKVGGPLGNAGITAADLQRLPDGSFGFFFRIASSFPETVEADLVLTHEGSGERIYKLIPLKIVPGENPPERFALPEAPDGAWTATLDLDDALEKDNRAYLTVPEPNPVRVAVATKDRFFFEVSVLSFERGAGILQLVDATPEVVLGTGSLEAGTTAAVVFAPSEASPHWGTPGEEVEVVAPRVVLDDHPILRHLEAESITFAGARQMTAPPGSLVLVESEAGTPLIFLTKQEGRGVVVVNLDPVASEFVLSPWFPVLIQGAALHLAGRGAEPVALYRPGDRVSVPGFREGQSSKVIAPDGTETAVAGPEYGPIEQLGFHSMESPVGSWRFGSTLATAVESLLDNSAIAATAGPLAKGHAPASWLIFLALVLLVAESVLYHRRKVG